MEFLYYHKELLINCKYYFFLSMDCKRQAVRHYVMYVSDPRVLKQNHANDFVSGTDVETA